MKTDPDFHPLAAKWLDGQASPPERAVLQEILSADPEAMEEFAALCRTETLLRQVPQDQAARRQVLEALLAGKPWPKRVMNFCGHPYARRTAAAAALALGSWAIWRLGAGTGHDSSAFTQNPPALPTLRIPGNPGGKSPDHSSAEEDDGGNIDPELRRWLERMSVTEFKAHGSLSGFVAESLSGIKGMDGKMIPVRVLDEGDAPVFLEFQALMPTWHLLKLMALQTGTALSMEDGALVFRRAEKPEPLEDCITRGANLNNLRALLVLRERNQEGDMPAKYAEMVEQALGSRLAFGTDSEKSISVSGSSRDVKVLKAALTAALASPIRMNLSVAMITVPPRADSGVPGDPAGNAPAENVPSMDVNPLNNPSATVVAEILQSPPQPGLNGVFTAPQYSVMLRGIFQKPGVRFRILMEQPVIPNQENLAASLETTGDGGSVRSGTSIIVKTTDDTAALDIVPFMDSESPLDLREEHASISTQVLVWFNQTAYFGGFRHPDGSEVGFFITASDPEDSTGQSADTGTPASASGTSAGESAAVPVPGKPGFVTSPYVTGTAAAFDVSSLKHGSSLTCPLTGRKFRIP
ncbi:MAG: hypothetical protein V4726_14040 [Verrucomicrobiota bacterium]